MHSNGVDRDCGIFRDAAETGNDHIAVNIRHLIITNDGGGGIILRPLQGIDTICKRKLGKFATEGGFNQQGNYR